MKKLFLPGIFFTYFFNRFLRNAESGRPNGIVYPKHGLGFLRVLGRIVR